MIPGEKTVLQALKIWKRKLLDPFVAIGSGTYSINKRFFCIISIGHLQNKSEFLF